MRAYLSAATSVTFGTLVRRARSCSGEVDVEPPWLLKAQAGGCGWSCVLDASGAK